MVEDQGGVQSRCDRLREFPGRLTDHQIARLSPSGGCESSRKSSGLRNPWMGWPPFSKAKPAKGGPGSSTSSDLVALPRGRLVCLLSLGVRRRAPSSPDASTFTVNTDTIRPTFLIEDPPTKLRAARKLWPEDGFRPYGSDPLDAGLVKGSHGVIPETKTIGQSFQRRSSNRRKHRSDGFAIFS